MQGVATVQDAAAGGDVSTLFASVIVLAPMKVHAVVHGAFNGVVVVDVTCQ